jgi:hypothetical protein
MGEYRMCLSGLNSSFILTTRLYGRVKDVFIRIKFFIHLNYLTLWESKECSPLSDILEVIK